MHLFCSLAFLEDDGEQDVGRFQEKSNSHTLSTSSLEDIEKESHHMKLKNLYPHFNIVSYCKQSRQSVFLGPCVQCNFSTSHKMIRVKVFLLKCAATKTCQQHKNRGKESAQFAVLAMKYKKNL